MECVSMSFIISAHVHRITAQRQCAASAGDRAQPTAVLFVCVYYNRCGVVHHCAVASDTHGKVDVS